MNLAAIVIELLRDASVREALREALSSTPLDAPIPLARAAAELGVKPRSLRDAASRGELKIEGPRNARVVRRSELDRWLASSAPKPRARLRPIAKAKVDEDRDAFERTALRIVSRGR